MPKISSIIAEKGDTPYVAFEYFPPRTAEGVASLQKRFVRMASQGAWPFPTLPKTPRVPPSPRACPPPCAAPAYADVTWGAGGATSDTTLALCVRMKEDSGMEPNMHLTCTNMPVEKITAALEGCVAAGISNIVALRGDPPKGEAAWKATEGGFSCALDLVRYMREKHGGFFHISVAGYPEGHPTTITKVDDPHSLSPAERRRVVSRPDGEYVCRDAAYAGELAYLKQKVDAGADMIITQMFFDDEVYLQFVKDCRSVGINVPIQPGIMLVQSYAGFQRMTELCMSRVPLDVVGMFEAVKDNDVEVKAAGLKLAERTCKRCVGALPFAFSLSPPRRFYNRFIPIPHPPSPSTHTGHPTYCHPTTQHAQGGR
jgi:methylenetetrahydrofolate reductase (NADPH)